MEEEEEHGGVCRRWKSTMEKKKMENL